jgi:hypothetical protein
LLAGADGTNTEHVFPTTGAANIDDHNLPLQNSDAPRERSPALSFDQMRHETETPAINTVRV